MMSLRSPGRTAPARSRTISAATAAPRPVNSAQSSGTRTTRASRSRALSEDAPMSAPASPAAASGGVASPAAAAFRRAPSRSTPRKFPATNSARAPLRTITSSASGPVNRVLTGTSTAPALSAPSAASIHSPPLGAHSATRSPASIPAAISAADACSTRSASSR
jgi:hypothetical protein